MLKVNPEPANRRPIVPRKDSQHTEEYQLTDQENPEPQHGRLRLITDEVINRRQDIMPSKAMEHNAKLGNHKLTKQADGIAQAPPLPHHLLKRTQAPTVNTAPEETTFHAKFHKYWRHQCVIGEGGDGIVHLYQRPKEEGVYVAVKVPQSYSTREDLVQEIINMRIVGRHEHIIELCFASRDWCPFGPAMFLPYCELGDLITYRESWCAQQEWEGKPERVSEITMCKLFRDMVLALNYLHNELGTRYIHNDFKPQNILAFMSDEYIGTDILPEEPIFRLSDFARLTPWPTPNGRRPQGFDGTPEYAPPAQEQLAPIKTSADIWGLGATLQYMALGICPIQSREAFIWSRKVEGRTHPDINDEDTWMSEYWRTRIPTVFRPINVPVSALRKHYDVSYDLPGYQPFGARIGYWYAQLWKPLGSRPKASRLVRDAVPHMEDHIERLKLKRIKQMRYEKENAAVCGLAELE